MNDLKQVMSRKYRFLVAKGKVKEEDDGTETILAAAEFKGKCYKCGQVRNKANDPKCPMYNKSMRFRGKCNKCGKYGHREKDCWENEENKDKRPSGWKSRTAEERNNIAVNDELLL